MKKRILIIAMVLAAVVTMNGCRFVPGSEQWYIQRAAKQCIRHDGLQAGERLVFINGTQRECTCEWNGEACKYVAVKYAVKQADGSKTHRIAHLLLSENGKQTLDASFDGQAEWVMGKDIDAINTLINNMGW